MRTLADLQGRTPTANDPTAGTDPATGLVPTLPLAVSRTRTFDTPAFRGITFHEVTTKSVLNRVQGMPFKWSINPYRGCSHACSYCFARPTHRYLNLSPLADFERQVIVKTNLVEVLRAELAKRTWRGEHVAMGTNTDPYQRAEGRYRLMPGVIDALAASRTPFSILTKGTLITRDVPALQRAATRVPVAAALTVGMLDRELWRSSEPGTPSPRARLAAVRRLNDAGIPTGVMLAPIMPGLNDGPEQLAELVDAAARAGAVHISPIVLHLRREVRGLFWPWLAQRHPGLVSRYEELYARGGTAAASYREPVEAFVAAERRRAWRRHGRPPTPPGWRGSRDDPRPPVAIEPGSSDRGGVGASADPTRGSHPGAGGGAGGEAGRGVGQLTLL